MASKTVPVAAAQELTGHAGRARAIDPARINVVLEATWESDALLEMLNAAVGSLRTRNTSEDLSQFELQARGLYRRLQDLNNVVMSAIGDEDHDTRDLERQIHGIAIVQPCAQSSHG